MKKLHLGCGNHLLDGWINTDNNLDQKTKFVRLKAHPSGYKKYLDVTKPFSMEDNEVDYIFSEHLIEHIQYHEGKFMLDECYRVLNNRGKIRISTPDLAFLINLYRDDKTDLQNEYIDDLDYSFNGMRYFINGKIDFPTDTFVINNFVRAWGHKFIYDEKTLRDLMTWVGFKDIKRYKIDESDDSNFVGLSNKSRLPDGHLELETFVLEGVK